MPIFALPGVQARIQCVKKFRTIEEAKNFLVEMIASEADHEGVPLSEVERKMLYFSESGWTLPDIRTVSTEFERDYDENDYEQKIAGFVRMIEARNHPEKPGRRGSLGRSVY